MDWETKCLTIFNNKCLINNIQASCSGLNIIYILIFTRTPWDPCDSNNTHTISLLLCLVYTSGNYSGTERLSCFPSLGQLLSDRAETKPDISALSAVITCCTILLHQNLNLSFQILLKFYLFLDTNLFIFSLMLLLITHNQN